MFSQVLLSEMWRGIILISILFSYCFAQDLVVQVQDGKVQGAELSTPSGRKFYTWRHIPFAKPPLGKLRFQPPVKSEPWDGILDGSKDSKACLFVGSYKGDPVPTYGNSEDCLYINVYSPVKPNSNLSLPVMFWIYGGGFIVGTGDFSFTDPTPILEEDVIVVTFNYRLSIFGSLSTEDLTLPGNAALKDQLLALIWTKENIASFGGNPLDITIFGESAGAGSVGYHLISPKSRNLFTGAIMQSGTAIFNGLQVDARSNAIYLANKVDSSISNSSSSEEILEVLQNADAHLLVNLTLDSNIKFFPVIEVENPGSFVTEPLYEQIEAGNINQVPIIIGTNSAEQLHAFEDIPSSEKLAAYYDANPNLLLPSMHLKDGVSVEEVTKQIKEAYVKNGNFTDNLAALLTFLSDNTFVRSSVQHAVLQSKFTPVYFYQFTFYGSLSVNHPKIPGGGRVAHAEDVGYLFNISTKHISTDADFRTRRTLVKLWTNFAKTKNPTPNDDSRQLLDNAIWEKFNVDKIPYLDIGDKLELKFGFKKELIAFWNYIWNSYSYRPYNTY